MIIEITEAKLLAWIDLSEDYISEAKSFLKEGDLDRAATKIRVAADFLTDAGVIATKAAEQANEQDQG